MDQQNQSKTCTCDCGTCTTADSNHCGRCGKCNCVHHKIVPGMIALIAITFLLGAFDVVSARFVTVTWPILLLVAAIGKMAQSKCKCC